MAQPYLHWLVISRIIVSNLVEMVHINTKISSLEAQVLSQSCSNACPLWAKQQSTISNSFSGCLQVLMPNNLLLMHLLMKTPNNDFRRASANSWKDEPLQSTWKKNTSNMHLECGQEPHPCESSPWTSFFVMWVKQDSGPAETRNCFPSTYAEKRRSLVRELEVKFPGLVRAIDNMKKQGNTFAPPWNVPLSKLEV